MSVLINLYNQTAAGPKNISLNLISRLFDQNDYAIKPYILVPNTEQYATLQSNDFLQIIKLPKFNNILKKIGYRIYLDLILIPKLTKKYRVKSYLAFGNYLLSPLNIKKTVLLHHAYLFDDNLFNKLTIIPKLIEKCRRAVFWLTLKNVNNVVVQSNYVLNQFKNKWPSYAGEVILIPNPISSNFVKQTQRQINDLIENRINTSNNELSLLYVSRYYPHKNHGFLLDVSAELTRRKIKHKILITLDESIKEANEYLKTVDQLEYPIINLGEVDQQTLHGYYQSAHALLFVSKSETFGNPLVEAMSYGLPIIVPKLEYAISVVGEEGLYFKENDYKSCVETILLLQNPEHYRQKSTSMYHQYKLFPDVKKWVGSYIALMHSPT